MKRHRQQQRAHAGSTPRTAGPAPGLAERPRTHAKARGQGVIDLTEQDLAAAIDGHPFAVLHFWAPLSASSRDFGAALEAASAGNPDILFARINAEEQRAIVAQFNIRSIPTLMIFRSNIIVFAKAGALPPVALAGVLDAARALDMDAVRRQVVSVDAVALGDAAALEQPAADAETDAQARLLSLETYLRPPIRTQLAEAASRLAAGRLVVIPDAFESDFAERMHASLDRCRTWRPYEGYEGDFHFHHHNLYTPEEYPEDLAWCSRVFQSPMTKSWAASLSGRACPGPAEFSASLYLPGDHSLPHNDVAASEGGFRRQVAYVWHLAKDWQPEWGGALYWCSKGCYLPPAFNTLYLFNVGPESSHFVTRVSPYAQGKRLAINGWWTGPAATGDPERKGAERIGAAGAEIAVH